MAKKYFDKRNTEEAVFKCLMVLSIFIVAVSLISILATVLVKGIGALNIAMLTKTPEGGYYLGKTGGILNAILGSVILGVGATLMSLVISLPVVCYLNLYLKKNSRFALLVRFSLDVLWGVPSIVYGAFGFAAMLFLGLKASLLSGTVTVALLITPIMARSMDEIIRIIPFELKEAAYALGSTRLETAFKIIFKQAQPAILAATLVAFGRGIGDAACVLFTAGFTDSLPYSLFKPVATLPLAIFFQLGTPFPEVQKRGYAAALILTLLILTVSLSARFLSKRFTEHLLK
ncbi:MAG: phosphate ABC transporter permease PstA [Candidatus Omnitrophica bacterium]|nr:phosphate ABC transporter permease PstA [Candidatus Omnitrophota bacterium]MDD5236045.1 phosphate ABC transporter permease PstA [Candidatus Omnitrophota bacterium]MDD5609919.1 phosphate ABC transporter permease PstA [Candidatus Omnitrophota bacterium]